jgi:GDP-4-dehydro-6-deoxy-D-mannose reductase
VGTAFVYGRSAIDTSPVDETALLQPMDLYGTTKASGDMAVGMLVEKGLRCVRLRPFNHTGRLQSTDFAIPQFAYQIAQIEAGLRDPVLRTGNLEDTRDFLDVRDVVAAYGQLIANTDQLTPGSVFNVASGIGWTMSSVLDALLAKSTASISVELDLERSKRSSLPKLIGCASALKTAIRWAPRYTLDETLDNVLDGFRSR